MTTLDQLVEPWERSLGCHLSEGPMTKFRLDTLSFYVKDPKNGWTTWLTFSHHCMTNQIGTQSIYINENPITLNTFKPMAVVLKMDCVSSLSVLS